MVVEGLKKYIRSKIRNWPYIVQWIYFRLLNTRGYRKWLREGKPIPACSLAKLKRMDSFRKKRNYAVFIETGTYLGDTVFHFLKKFERIYSIELDTDLFQRATKRFAQFEHVQILEGDSGKEIIKVLKEIRVPSMFWLDGHYSGGITALGENASPILEELAAILTHSMDHIIFIDDARLFTGTGGYPTLEELQHFVRERKPEAIISIEYDILSIEFS